MSYVYLSYQKTQVRKKFLRQIQSVVHIAIIQEDFYPKNQQI